MPGLTLKMPVFTVLFQAYASFLCTYWLSRTFVSHSSRTVSSCDEGDAMIMFCYPVGFTGFLSQNERDFC